MRAMTSEQAEMLFGKGYEGQQAAQSHVMDGACFLPLFLALGSVGVWMNEAPTTELCLLARQMQ